MITRCNMEMKKTTWCICRYFKYVFFSSTSRNFKWSSTCRWKASETPSMFIEHFFFSLSTTVQMGSRVWLKLWLSQFEMSAASQGLHLTGSWWLDSVEKSCFKENSWPAHFQIGSLRRHYIVSSNYKQTWSLVAMQTSGQELLAHEAANLCSGTHHNKDCCSRRRKFLSLASYSTTSTATS